MNKIYKVIYNRARNMYQVVSEIVHSRGKTRSLQSRVRPQSLARLVAATLLAMSIGLPVGWAADGDTTDTTTTTTYIDSTKTTDENVKALDTQVTKNAADISTNKTNIATNTSNISSNKTAIDKNTTDIATNTSNISSNKTAIDKNTTDIAAKANISMDNLSDAGKQVIQALMDIQSSDNVTVSSTTTTAGVKTYTITVKTDGAVAKDNTGIVSGGTLYSEVRPTTDGTYVKSTNTTAANLTALDTQVATNTTNISTNTTDISNLKNLSNITTDGKTAIKNLLNVVGDNDQVTVTSSEDSTSGTKTYKVSVKKNGTISATDENIVTGKTVYDYFTSQLGTVTDGTYVKSSNTIAANLSALDTNLKNVIDAIGLDENDTTQSYTSKLNKYFKVNPKITTSTDGTTTTTTYAPDAAANGTNSIAIGPSAQTGESTTDATTSTTTVTGGTSSTAVGDSAKANGDKSVALGYSA